MEGGVDLVRPVLGSAIASSPVCQMAANIAVCALRATPSALAVTYARWNRGQLSAAIHEAGRYSATALGGSLFSRLSMYGRKALQAGQPYEKISVTATTPGCAGGSGWGSR